MGFYMIPTCTLVACLLGGTRVVERGSPSRVVEFSFFRAYLFNSSVEMVVARLRQLVLEAVLRNEVAFFDVTKTGELVSRIASDTSLLKAAVTPNISMALRWGGDCSGWVDLPVRGVVATVAGSDGTGAGHRRCGAPVRATSAVPVQGAAGNAERLLREAYRGRQGNNRIGNVAKVEQEITPEHPAKKGK